MTNARMMARDELILDARKAFVAWNNAFEPDQPQLDADDTEYFYPPAIMSDVAAPNDGDRILVVYQGLNDELHFIGFIIFTYDDYREIRGLIIEADTNYSVVVEPK